MKKLYKFLICLCCLCACTQVSNITRSTKEQILRINFLVGSPKFIHPHISRDTEGVVLCKALFEGLTRVNNRGKVELALARKIEISPNKLKYTIHLRDSKWANGEELTADHFVKSWKSAFQHKTRCIQPYRFFIIKNAEKIFEGKLPIEKAGVYAIGKDQIEIHLEHPAPYFTQLLADPIYSPIFDYSKTQLSVFNGPFLLKSFHPGKGILLKKNPSYWDVPHVQLDGIDISFVTDPMTAYELFQKEKLDYIGSPLSDLPEEVLRNTKGLLSADTCASYWMNLNIKTPKLSSKALRKALSLSIDRDYIAKYILPNANPSFSIIPEELSCYNNSISQSTEYIQELFVKGLEEIGSTTKDFSFTLRYTSTPRHALLAKYLKYQWEKVFNIQVILEKSDWSTFCSNLTSHNYEMGGWAKYTTYADPLYFLEYFYEGKLNISNWENIEFKKWIDLANQCTSKRE